MDQGSKIFVAGHRGMVGSAILRKLRLLSFNNILLATSDQLDLRNQNAVNQFFEDHKPEYVFLAAAKVGGIHANNTYKADFIYDNIMIQSNVIHAAKENNCSKLLFLGSSCIYPKKASQPMQEDALLTGLLEPTNQPYAIAKIAGIEMCNAYRHQYNCNFISAMPTNLYGPNDNYDLANSHVLPALLRKFHIAKKNNDPTVTLWGTGTPLREFLHVDDLANACVFLMNNYNEAGHINVGSGHEISIAGLANLIAKVVGYEGELVHDYDKPDGTPRKLMDSSRLHDMGWQAEITLEEGIHSVYSDLSDEDWY